jgi:lipopolysaccharide/colanic/teichoic acid biosynthesis glycosyltransferase
MPDNHPKLCQLAVKRAVDIAMSLLGLIILSPLLIGIGLAIIATSPGPALFRQARLGRDGVPFRICKYRTMYQGSEAKAQRDDQGANVIPDNDPRITPLGKVLRRLSLDELPQLWNVLKGEMSLVGPRPDETLALPLYAEGEKAKLLMKPGITGLAMVNGRNSISWRERIQWDVKYVQEFSLGLDLEIVWRTVRVVVQRQGVYTSQNNTSRHVSRRTDD